MPHQTKTTEIMYWLCPECYDEAKLDKRKIRIFRLPGDNAYVAVYMSCGKCGKPTLISTTHKVAITYPQSKGGMAIGKPEKERIWQLNHNYIIVCHNCLEIEWIKLKLKNKNPFISVRPPSTAIFPWPCNNCKKRVSQFDSTTITY